MKMKMSMTKAIKTAVDRVTYLGAGRYSVSDGNTLWEYTLRAGSSPVIAIRNIRARYAMECMFGDDGATYIDACSYVLSQPGSLRDVVRQAISEYVRQEEV
jgi:hypothetical protein